MIPIHALTLSRKGLVHIHFNMPFRQGALLRLQLPPNQLLHPSEFAVLRLHL
jgi:hypothetical protein